MDNCILQLDFALLDLIQKTKCAFLDGCMPVFSLLGNYGLIWILLAIILLCIKKHRKSGAMLCVGLLTGFVFVNLLLKPLVARPRPFSLVPYPLIVNPPADFSFPSGHTMAAFSAAFLLFAANKKWGTIALILAAFIAFSRLYLYVHFPTDVLFSILLAAAVAVLVRKIFARKH